MRIVDAFQRGLGAVTLAVFALHAGAASDALTTAREHFTRAEWSEVIAVLDQHLRFEVSTPQIDDLMGQALLKLGRRDEAAHYFERALGGWPADDKETPKLRKRLTEADTLFARRETLFKKITKELLQCAADLEAGGHRERALELLERLQPIAVGAEKTTIADLAGKIRAATEEVDLDQKGDQKPEGGWPEIQVESQRYRLRVHLEPAVAELLGKTMDEIFLYYLQIYFDNDESRLSPRKATIVIHPSHAEMVSGWQGPNTPAGWWSPGDWEVHAYDTRTDSGTLDAMLETLFHEASHHFMTMLERGGNTPAWLNEGTASFFEGASAMADGRVLWPDAARMRLYGLDMMLKGQSGGRGRIPTFLDVISYDKPGSYPGEYYEFGWGIVYFLQQFEDPTTLAYVYRPLYNAYRDEIIKKGGDPRELFERVFLGPASPLSHTTLLEFEKDWKQWIQGHVYPLHHSSDRRALRLAEVDRYMAAAARVAKDKKAKVGERELLLRALGHLDFVRTKIDKEDEPDARILTAQADLFERVGQAESAAPILERLLDLASTGTWEATDAELEALAKRLSKLDSKNAGLRMAKARTKSLARLAAKLLEDYRRAKPVLLMRSYTFASLCAAALDNDKALTDAAQELRGQAREAGVLKGASFKLSAAPGSWKTIFTGGEGKFDVAQDRVSIESVRPAGRLCTAVPISGEYELRARLTLGGETKTGSQHGLIVSGTEGGDWIVMTISHDSRIVMRRMMRGQGGVSDVPIEFAKLERTPERGVPFDFVAHVLPSGKVEITVGDQGPFPFEMPLVPPAVAYVGAFVKYGELTVENAVVEILP